MFAHYDRLVCHRDCWYNAVRIASERGLKTAFCRSIRLYSEVLSRKSAVKYLLHRRSRGFSGGETTPCGRIAIHITQLVIHIIGALGYGVICRILAVIG